MAKVLTIQHGNLLNKQEQILEELPLSMEINLVGASP